MCAYSFLFAWLPAWLPLRASNQLLADTMLRSICLFAIPLAVPRERVNENDESDHTDSSAEVPIFVLTPPPVDERAWAGYLEIDKSDRKNEVAKQYGTCVKEIGDQYGCQVIDVFTLLCGEDPAVYPQHLSDGLHLSGSGNQLVADEILRTVKERFPHLVPVSHEEKGSNKSGLPEEEPHFSELC